MKEIFNKIVESLGTAMIARFFACAFLLMAFSRLFPVGFAAFLVAALCALKECLYDDSVNWKDLLADGLGILLGVITMIA